MLLVIPYVNRKIIIIANSNTVFYFWNQQNCYLKICMPMWLSFIFRHRQTYHSGSSPLKVRRENAFSLESPTSFTLYELTKGTILCGLNYFSPRYGICCYLVNALNLPFFVFTLKMNRTQYAPFSKVPIFICVFENFILQSRRLLTQCKTHRLLLRFHINTEQFEGGLSL